MMSFKEYLMEAQAGTYAAVRPSKEDGDKIQKFMGLHNIPNPEPTDKLHATLLYSRKHLPDYEPDTTLVHDAKIDSLEVWNTKSGKNCLVAKITSPSLANRYTKLMVEHGATAEYSEFKPHISLSYDIGNFDISKLKVSQLPKSLKMTDEYKEALDTNGK